MSKIETLQEFVERLKYRNAGEAIITHDGVDYMRLILATDMRASLVAGIAKVEAELTYERQRRIAAEKVIDNELNGYETYEEATRNLLKWQEIVNQQPKP